VLCEVRANVLEKLKRAGILSRLGATGVYATLAEYSARQDSLSSGSSQ